MISLDCETVRTAPGCQVPDLVCTAVVDESRSALLPYYGGEDWILSLIETSPITGHNVSFDLAVWGRHVPLFLPKIFQAYEEDRVTCTLVRQKLLDVACGRLSAWVARDGKEWQLGYGLGDNPKPDKGAPKIGVATRVLGRNVEKEDTWRLRYGELRPYPIETWPEEARTYPIEDARTALEIWHVQERSPELLVDQHRQARAAWWLQLMRAWGFHTDPQKVRELANAARAEQLRLLDVLVREGLVRAPRALKSGPRKGMMTEPTRNEKATRDRLTSVYLYAGRDLPLTDGGQTSIDEPACKASGDPVLVSYARYSSVSKRLSTDVPIVEAGIAFPIQPYYDSLKENGRTGTSAPNCQNWPREMIAAGERPAEGPAMRECAVPRSGYLFASADYSQIELHTLAQVCLNLFGQSDLADALNAGVDPHLALAAEILGITYEEAKANKGRADVKKARQASKPPNFGLPGGLGVDRLIELAQNDYDVAFTRDEAQAFKNAWFRRWREMRPYLALINQLIERGGVIEQHFSGRIRGGLAYCDAANTFFSGLAADLAKDAGFAIARACYVDTSSILWGARPCLFSHDEFILEAPEHKAAECAEELARIMVEVGWSWLPQVKPKAEPCLSTCWSKEMETLRNENGRLIPWDPSMIKKAS